MKPSRILLILALGLLVSVAFAETRKDKPTAKMELSTLQIFIHSPVLLITDQSVAEPTGERIAVKKAPERRLKVRAGYESSIFRPPTKNRKNLIPYSKRL